MNEESLLYTIAIQLIEGVGPVNAKNLIAYCGSAKAVFKAEKKELFRIPKIGNFLVEAIFNQNVLPRAEEELKFITKNNIVPFTYLDDNYPTRLKHCSDSPLVLYGKGSINMNTEKVISIVGTRNATPYGKKITEDIINDLQNLGVLVVSGLAYGIDITAHQAALKFGLPTIGVLAHGLDKIYPSNHTQTATNMMEEGGIITEFMSGTIPDRENFPKRNRIVAGMTDATLVIESKNRGGSLITAQLANSYNRDVFAVPGKINDEHSQGCNWLIKTHRAALIDSAEDIIKLMNWETKNTQKPKQFQLFTDLTEEESKVVELLKGEKLHIDELTSQLNTPQSKLSVLLLDLEFKNVIQSFPGKMYGAF